MKLDRSSFKRILGPLEQLLEKNSELYHKYYDVNEAKDYEIKRDNHDTKRDNHNHDSKRDNHENNKT